MALHQFKIKHYTTNGRHKKSVNSKEMGDPDAFSRNEGSSTPIENIAQRSNDPILLYKPSDIRARVIQSYRLEEEDLFSACHNDLIQDMKSNYSKDQNYPSNGNILDKYHCKRDESFPQNRTESPHPAIRVESVIKPTNYIHKTKRKSSHFSASSMRQNDHRNGTSSQISHNSNIYQNSHSPYTSLNETRSFTHYSSQQSLEIEKLQLFYHQMATHMECPIVCPVTSHQFPMNLLNTSNGILQPRLSFHESLSDVGAFYHTPNYEFENTKRMLVEGVRLVCDGARETMDRMESKKGMGSTHERIRQRNEHAFSQNETCEDICGKLTYIQSAFLQLAECNDPEILNEARRIIPVDLLHRLLRQLQEHSFEDQKSEGIT